jgi:K+-sensing histidine kinase KdpD
MKTEMNRERINTKYAPVYRHGVVKLKQELDQVLGTNYVSQVLNGLPYIAAILNEHRQIVFANNTLLEQINLKVLDELLGDRPGEVLHCVNSKKEIGGCGTSENCSYCGAVKTILQCQQNMTTYTDECRIQSNKNGYVESFDFKVSSSPLVLDNQRYIIFTLLDISTDKRKKVLEKIFFHDVINKAGSLQGFINLVKSAGDQNRMRELISIMDEIAIDLTQEILSQRDLLTAENGELKVKISELYSADIIESSVNQILNHEVAINKSVKIDQQAATQLIHTDEILLKRILTNMLKNALEATKINGVVTIGCDFNDGYALFWVHNVSPMPRAVQLQVFQRSFSTKGKDRGLGTYSMKLLGERYLKGRVYFQTSETKGTTFYLEIPTKTDD